MVVTEVALDIKAVTKAPAEDVVVVDVVVVLLAFVAVAVAVAAPLQRFAAFEQPTPVQLLLT